MVNTLCERKGRIFSDSGFNTPVISSPISVILFYSYADLVGNSKIREEAMENWNELWEKSNMISVYNYYYQIIKNNVVSMKFKTND